MTRASSTRSRSGAAPRNRPAEPEPEQNPSQGVERSTVVERRKPSRPQSGNALPADGLATGGWQGDGHHGLAVRSQRETTRMSIPRRGLLFGFLATLAMGHLALSADKERGPVPIIDGQNNHNCGVHDADLAGRVGADRAILGRRRHLAPKGSRPRPGINSLPSSPNMMSL